MKILIISAHPDDEAIGAGGTLLKHQAKSDDIYWVIATKMFTPAYSDERIKERNHEIEEVAKKIGIKGIIKIGFDTMSLNSENYSELVKKLGAEIDRIKPERIYSPSHGDAHSDHQYVFEAAWACTKSFRYPSVKSFLMYECISETEFGAPIVGRSFTPNFFIDISNHLEGKLELCSMYANEFGEHPFPRSMKNIEALATYRGSYIGTTYAEAFQLLKWAE